MQRRPGSLKNEVETTKASKDTFQRSRASAATVMTGLIDRLFCSSHTALYGPYRRLDEGAVLLPDLLYRYRVIDTSDVPATLQVFTGIGRMGGQLWEQEVRVLLRISAVGHPALPRIIDGSYDEESDIAFVVTEAAEHTLAAPEALPFLRSRPADCVRHLGLLADALAVLHGQGLMHRNLWPGSVDVVEEGRESGKLRLRLARFEMSALVSNLLRRVSPDARQGDEDVRRLFLGQGPRALAYFPPERLAFLFPDSRVDMLETDRSDVYGLGVMTWEWFVGPLPEERIPRQAGVEGGVPRWTADLRSHMASEITRSKLPARLQDLLRGMLDPDPRTRPHLGAGGRGDHAPLRRLRRAMGVDLDRLPPPGGIHAAGEPRHGVRVGVDRPRPCGTRRQGRAGRVPRGGAARRRAGLLARGRRPVRARF